MKGKFDIVAAVWFLMA